MGKVEGKNVGVGVKNTQQVQNEMGVGDMQMVRDVKDYYRGKGKKEEHMDLNLDVCNEEEDTEKAVDIEKEVGIGEELDEGMSKDCDMDMEMKNRNYP